MVAIDIEHIAENLRFSDGIWVTQTPAKISYPPGGHDLCAGLEDDSYWFRHRNNCILEILKQFPPRGIFFDVGGGNGFVARELEENGIATVLVEPGEAGVAKAGKRGLRHIVCATLENAGFKSRSLPAAGLFDVLEHIEDDRAFLQLLARLLKPGGKLYITVPAFHFLWSGEDDYAGHFRRYSRKGLRAILAETGFRVEYAGYFFSVLPFPVFLCRSLPHRLRVKRNKGRVAAHKSDHSLPRGIAGRLLEKIFKLECKRIGKGKSVPIGSSCLIAARRD